MELLDREERLTTYGHMSVTDSRTDRRTDRHTTYTTRDRIAINKRMKRGEASNGS